MLNGEINGVGVGTSRVGIGVDKGDCCGVGVFNGEMTGVISGGAWVGRGVRKEGVMVGGAVFVHATTGVYVRVGTLRAVCDAAGCRVAG